MQRNTLYKSTAMFCGFFFFSIFHHTELCAQNKQQPDKPPGTKKVKVIIEAEGTTDEDMDIEVIVDGQEIETTNENVWITDDGSEVYIIKKELILNSEMELEDIELIEPFEVDGDEAKMIKKEVIVLSDEDLSVDTENRKHIIKVTQTKDGKVDTLMIADGDLDIDIDLNGLKDLKELGVEIESLLKGLEIDIDEVLSTDEHHMQVKTISIELTDATAKETAKLSTDKKSKGMLQVEQLSVYPNPSTGSFDLKLSTEHKSPIDIEVFNMNGERIYQQTIKGHNGEYSGTINLDDSGKGTYFIQVGQGKQLITKKLVVQ